MKFKCFLQQFLTTGQIEQIIAKTDKKKIKRIFLGGIPADVLPDLIQKKKKCCWIWNTDDSSKPGQHWVGIFKNKKPPFFDSFRQHLSFYRWDIIPLMQILTKPLHTDESGTYGSWSILFLHYFEQDKLSQLKKVNLKNKLLNKIYLHNTMCKNIHTLLSTKGFM